MSNDNVTPINPETASKPKKARRTRSPKETYALAEPDGGPGCMRLIQALHGVCSAAEATADMDCVDPLEIATAAEILSEMPQDRLCP